MNSSFGALFGFLGGTIMSIEGGYKVLPKTPSERIFQRLSDAKWYLALCWCEQFSVPAGILNNTGTFSFHNEASLKLGDEIFLPPMYRQAVFKRCLSLQPLETVLYNIPVSNAVYSRSVEIQGIEIDPRYGKVALVREHESSPLMLIEPTTTIVSQR